MFRAEMAARSGGLLTREQVAATLGVLPAEVGAIVARGELLAVDIDSGGRFPAVQFRHGAVLPGLAAIPEALGDMNPWGKLQLLLAPLDEFGDERTSIMAMLARGLDGDGLDELVGLARGWAE